MDAFNCPMAVKKLFNVRLSPQIRVYNVPNSRNSNSLATRSSNSLANAIGCKLRVPKLSQQNPEISKVSETSTESRVLDRQYEEIMADLQRETLETLEWPSVCSQVSAFASTVAGRALCRDARLPIGRNPKESRKLLDQTAAASALPEPLDFSGIEDVSEIVGSAVAGQLLSIGELCAVERTLRSATRVFEQLEEVSSNGESTDRYSALLDVLWDCDFLLELAQKIGFCIDSTLSIVLDRASEKLQSIRLERKRNMENLESLLKEVSLKLFQVGAIDSPLVTKRRSRMCVGIKASRKSLLPQGIVLGVSSSGVTYFMEPRDAVKLNNMEVRLSNSEKAEELAILGFLTLEIANSETKIKHLMEKIVELDLASARGAYALWMNGVCPIFSEEIEKINSDGVGKLWSVDIEGIQHPLLLERSLRELPSVSMLENSNYNYLSRRVTLVDSENSSEANTPVPLNIKIGHTTKVVVISGPNTGGKTATMKTLGLASLMSKAGIFLPAKNRPMLPWFDQILADIGDHQSLEHNLSTFSGHISHLSKILEVASEESLVLIDEIGCGTDPSEGVALSTSILKYLAARVNLAMVTTHFADLSLLKATDSRFENAAMEFCLKTLRPTYRILWGSTGNSNALSIAKSIGLSQCVLDRAQEWVEKLLPDKQKERQGLLYQSLMEERNLLEAQAKEAASVLSEANRLYLEIYSEAEDLEKREAALKAKESQLVQQEFEAAKSEMDAIIKNFENQLKNARLDQLNSIMRESEAAIASIVAYHSPNRATVFGETNDDRSYKPQIGDRVYVKGLGYKVATVVEAPAEDGTTLVKYGKIKVRAKRNDMKPVQRTMKDTRSNSSSYSKRQVQRQGQYQKKVGLTDAKNDEDVSFGPVVQTSKNTIDLRGMRVEEASHQLHMAIDGCRSYRVLFVVHGMGTGAVKERALDVLRSHPRVARFQEESPMNYGCTIAYVK